MLVENNTFIFKGNIGLPEMYYISIDGENIFAGIFVEQSDINFNAIVDDFQIVNNFNDSIKESKAVEDDGLIWHQVGDLKGWGNEAGKLYAINSIPSNLLLDPEGIIIA